MEEIITGKKNERNYKIGTGRLDFCTETTKEKRFTLRKRTYI